SGITHSSHLRVYTVYRQVYTVHSARATARPRLDRRGGPGPRGHARPRGRDGGDWWADLANVARASRRVLLAHPWAAPLFARPLSGPNGELLTALLHDRLRAAGFPRRDADELHHQLSN